MKKLHAQYKYLNSGNIFIHYRILIQNSKRPTLVLIHGSTTNHTSWAWIYKKFEEQGYNTLTMDLRGHGKSQYERLKIKFMAEDIEKIIEHEKLKKIVLIGNCLGADIALILNKKLKNIKANYLLNPMAKNTLGNNKFLFFMIRAFNMLMKITPRRKNHKFKDYSNFYKLALYHHYVPLTYWKSLDFHNQIEVAYEVLNTKIDFNIKAKSRFVITTKDSGMISPKKVEKLVKKHEFEPLSMDHLILTRKPKILYDNIMFFLKSC